MWETGNWVRMVVGDYISFIKLMFELFTVVTSCFAGPAGFDARGHCRLVSGYNFHPRKRGPNIR